MPSSGPPTAALSSVATQLAELTARVSGLASEAGAREDELLAGELFEVERSLAAATRRVERLVQDAPTAP